MDQYVVPISTIDFESRYGICGYDQSHKNVISDKSANGECTNQEGLTCVWKNGYQMCPDRINDFYAEDIYKFPASIIVHELLHHYSHDPVEIQHYGTLCAEKLGWDIQNYSLEEFSDAWVKPPFASLQEEYAGMCPYVWQQFINSQQACP